MYILPVKRVPDVSHISTKYCKSTIFCDRFKVVVDEVMEIQLEIEPESQL